MKPKADLFELWVAYTQLGDHAEAERDALTEAASYLFEAWSFPRMEARILASLFLKPRSFGHLQWDVGFDAGDKHQARKVHAALGRLFADGYLIDEDPPRFSEHWIAVFVVLNPLDETRLSALLGVSTPAEALALCHPNPLVRKVR